MMKALFLVAVALTAQAAGKKRTAPPAPPKPVLKRVVELGPIANRSIELPDPTLPSRAYGENIRLALVNRLQKEGTAVILAPEGQARASSVALGAVATSAAPDPCVVNPRPIASSKLTIRVDELSFRTGSRAERMLYGFTRGFDNPYSARNEFPQRKDSREPGWFDGTFADTGGLLTGQELGHELNFDLLLVGASLKHAYYQATLGLTLDFENRFGGRRSKRVLAYGDGYYYELDAHIVGNTGDFRAGVLASRTTAMLDAFKRVVAQAAQSVAAELSRIPLVAALAPRCGDKLLINVGADYGLTTGQRFYDRTQVETGVTPAVFTVREVFQRSASVTYSGDGFSAGDELVSLAAGEQPPKPIPRTPGLALSALEGAGSGAATSTKNVNAGSRNQSLPEMLLDFVEGFFTRLWNGLKALVTLPYRIYRYHQYDQGYQGGELAQPSFAKLSALAKKSPALREIGLPAAWGEGKTGSRSVIIAVIDSGVDYNHQELRRNIFWDGAWNTPGWDFISGDSRPYDDHAHGTEIASVIAGGGVKMAGVAPNATIMTVKAFSPHGMTSSAALYAAFEYAVAKGARVIVTGWATRRSSQAFRDGIAMAAANGVLVIAAAGDRGENLDQHPSYPAALASDFPHNMITVAATGTDRALTRGSNSGCAVELAAPGTSVVAHPRDEYLTRSHSGIAAGFVAGAAAWFGAPARKWALLT